MFRVVPVLTNLSFYRSSSILRPSISGLLSPIQEPSDSEMGMDEIGKMNGLSAYRYVLIGALYCIFKIKGQPLNICAQESFQPLWSSLRSHSPLKNKLTKHSGTVEVLEVP